MKTAYHRKIKSIAWATAVFLVIIFAAIGWADKIPVDQVQISTPVYTPDLSEFDPKMGTYTYKVSWNGIPAGSVELELARNGGDYEIQASASTGKFIDLFYKLRYHTKAVLSAETLMPKHSVYFSRENSRKRETEMTFLPDGTIQSVRKDHRGVNSIEFDPDNFTLDPYSAAFLALSMQWKVGDTRQFDTFNGKSRYLIELTAKERTTIEVDGKPREAIVIVPSVQKLTDTESYKKLKEAKIYISTGSDREILKISSDLFIGSVETNMVAFTPEPAPIAKLRSGAPDAPESHGLNRHLPPVAALNEDHYRHWYVPARPAQ